MKLKACSLNTAVRMINPATLMRKESEGIINMSRMKKVISHSVQIYIQQKDMKRQQEKCHASKLNLELAFILRYHTKAKQQRKKKWTNQASSKFKCQVHQKTVLQGKKETHRMEKIRANFKIIPRLSKDLLELNNNQKTNNSI